MKLSGTTGTSSYFMLSLVCSSASADLFDRGGGLIYDDVLDITWLADANLASTNTFGLTGIGADGALNWSTAQSWIAAMNAAAYLGYSDWRSFSRAFRQHWGHTPSQCRNDPDVVRLVPPGVPPNTHLTRPGEAGRAAHARLQGVVEVEDVAPGDRPIWWDG